MEQSIVAVRGQAPGSGWHRVSHGLYLPPRADSGTDDERWHRELRAWLMVLPPDAVFTHVTAGRLMGWDLPRLPEDVPVFAATRDLSRGPRRAGLICRRLLHPSRPGTVHGLPVEEPCEVILAVARDLGVLDCVILIDSALRLGHLDHARMVELLASGRPGVRVLARAYALARKGVESAGETVLHLFHAALDVAVATQHEIRTDDGRLVARADLWLVGTWFVHEYDGAGHREPGQHGADLRRERRLAETPYVRRGYRLGELLDQPHALMRELDRALARAPRLSRLRRWQAMVDASLYRPATRARMRNRWRRQMGVGDWWAGGRERPGGGHPGDHSARSPGSASP